MVQRIQWLAFDREQRSKVLRGFVVVVLILVLVVGGRGIILKRTKNVRDEAKNFCNQMAPNGANKVSKGTKNVAKRIKNVAKGTKNVTNETLWP